MSRTFFFRVLIISILLVALMGSMAQAIAPTAAFSCSPTSGLSPLPVTCTDASTGSPTGWAWFFGDETYQNPFINITGTSTFTPASAGSVVVTPTGSIVLMEGYTTTYTNVTYISTNNGTSFSVQNASSGWYKRYGMTSVILPNGHIILMGGRISGASMNDTWRSVDNGATWQLMNASSGWALRYYASSVALTDGSIVTMGGSVGAASRSNDVWRSTDEGATWTQLTAVASWAARLSQQASVLPDNSIVLTGGYNSASTHYNDTWRSTDEGVTWTQINTSSGWSAREGHNMNTMPDGSLVLSGGQNTSSSTFLNDTWRSIDKGATWTQINTSSQYPVAGYSSSVVIPNGSLIRMGGANGTAYNSVWQFSPAGSYAQNPTHTYTSAPQSFNVALTAYNSAGYNTTLKTGYITIYGIPIVLFSTQKTTGIGQSLATFTDLSTNATAWNWSFQNSSTTGGNGTQITFSTSQNPTLLLHSGNFSVIENVTNLAGTYNASAPIWINVSAVVAGFSGTPLSGQTPLSTTFSDASTGSPTGWAWFFGDENYTQPWIEQSTSPGWQARQSHNVVSLPDGNIVLLFGGDASHQFSDVWRSTDKGVTWTLMNASTGYPGLLFANSLAMPDGSILIMGGYHSGSESNQTWRSVDEGATWTRMNVSSGWSAREASSSVVLPDGSIVLMGGTISQADIYVNDVWRSTDDGATWIEMNASVGWAARGFQSGLAFPDGNIIIFGGSDNTAARHNDTWISRDKGATWTQQSSSAGWTARDHMGTAVLPDGSAAIIAGNTNNNGYQFANDTWRSTDEGVTWTLMNVSNGWPLRYDFISVAMNDGSIISVGGTSQPSLGSGSFTFQNDTWRFQPVGSNSQNPVHQYTKPGIYSVSEMVTGSFGSNTLTKVNYTLGYNLTSMFTPHGAVSTWYPNGIAFTDTSYVFPPLSTWNWSWGDGTWTNGSNGNPYHFWFAPGIYNVSMKANNTYISGTNYTEVQVMRM